MRLVSIGVDSKAPTLNVDALSPMRIQKLVAEPISDRVTAGRCDSATRSPTVHRSRFNGPSSTRQYTATEPTAMSRRVAKTRSAPSTHATASRASLATNRTPGGHLARPTIHIYYRNKPVTGRLFVSSFFTVRNGQIRAQKPRFLRKVCSHISRRRKQWLGPTVAKLLLNRKLKPSIQQRSHDDPYDHSRIFRLRS